MSVKIKEREPRRVGYGYKLFVEIDGKYYPPMVANEGGVDTPLNVWLEAQAGIMAPPSKTGRKRVVGGGKGTKSSKISLAYRPGWHLGELPWAPQFYTTDKVSGIKNIMPKNLVWGYCEYSMDKNYQEEAMSYGYTANGKFRHAFAGLPKIPYDGYYRYRTNPNPNTPEWIITGAIKVLRILSNDEVDNILRENDIQPPKHI